MSEFGNFAALPWTNGGGESINATTLNLRETKIDQLDEECRRSQAISFNEYRDYFMSRSTNIIVYFEDNSQWSISDGSKADDSTYNRVGRSGVKVIENNATAGWMRIYRTDLSLWLDTFQNDDDTSATSDYICLMYYVTDAAKVSYVTIRLGQDTSNYFYYSWNSGFSTGYNYYYVAKSAFSTGSGSPSWSSQFTYVAVGWQSTASATNEYITFDILTMIRQEGGKMNPYLLDDGNGNWDVEIFEPQTWMFTYLDPFVGKSGITKGGGTWEYGIHAYCEITDFVAEIEHYVTVEDELSNFRWIIDANNYIDIYATGGNLYIDEYVAASGGHVGNLSIPGGLSKHTKVRTIIEKNGIYIRVIMKYDRWTIAEEYETSLSEAGCIYIGGSMNNSNFSFISDFVISHMPTNLLSDDCTYPKIIKNETVESSSDNSSWINVDDCTVNFGEGIYECELKLHYNCASETPDLTLRFNAGGGVELMGGIGVIGPAVGITDPKASEESKIASYDTLTDEIYFGTDVNVGYAVISFLVKVSSQAYLLPQFHQRNNDGSNPVYVRKETYFKVTRVSR